MVMTESQRNSAVADTTAVTSVLMKTLKFLEEDRVKTFKNWAFGDHENCSVQKVRFPTQTSSKFQILINFPFQLSDGWGWILLQWQREGRRLGDLFCLWKRPRRLGEHRRAMVSILYKLMFMIPSRSRGGRKNVYVVDVGLGMDY